MNGLPWKTCPDNSSGHEWEALVGWSGRYRCKKCGTIGHHAIITAESKYNPVTTGIIPYRCSRCFLNAVGKYRTKQFSTVPKKWCCKGHIPKWVLELKEKLKEEDCV